MEDLIGFLPPGFQFDPTDEDLIGYFLYRKASDLTCNPSIIPDIDFCSSDPWELHEKAFLSKNQYYFFSRLLENRATQKGRWEELDVEETILTGSGKKLGIKKCLGFFVDQVPNKIQTTWLMEEYHLSRSGLLSRYYKRGRNQPQDLSEWVLCRVHDAKTDSQFTDMLQTKDDGHEVELSLLDEVFLSMEDDQDEITFP